MKRKIGTVPEDMVQRWNRPPLSCRLCRAKKLRCDRTQPCSNCVLRKASCEYSGQGPSDSSDELQGGNQPPAATISTTQSRPQPATVAPSAYSQATSSLDPVDVLSRIRRLEEAVFAKSQEAQDPSSGAFSTGGINPTMSSSITNGAQATGSERGISFAELSISASGRNIDSLDDWIQDMRRISACLPPWTQARQLFQQFVIVIQPTFGVLHIPTIRALINESYQTMLEGGEPTPAVMMLLLSIFAGASLVATRELLQTLNATQTEANSAFRTYTRLAIAIVDNALHPIPPSTVALGAISTLAHVLGHADGYSEKVQALRLRAILMARTMQIHHLDTAKSQDERKCSGYDIVEVEVQRRIWWHIVSSDWIVSFSQGPQEGTYFIHPNHMKVNHPANIDDELLTPSGPEQTFPPSTPTSMSVFLLRIQHAELCREVVDTLSSTFISSSPPDYDIILTLDQKFHTFITSVPAFFKIDPASIQQSQSVTRDRPYIAWQRTIGHLGFHVRLCRLHRPFHREGSTNPKYAYSRSMCIRSAQTVLDLRRSLDEVGTLVGLKPSHYWLVMHHVFFAAMVLATDVSMNPIAPGAEARKQEVIDVVQMLEKSRHLSTTLMEAIQKNTQTLVSILQGSQREQQQQQQQARVSNATMFPGTCDLVSNDQLRRRSSGVGDGGIMAGMGQFGETVNTPGDGAAWSGLNEAGKESWGQLWTDLFNVAPEEIDGLQWDLLLNDWDLPFQTAF
ncbi:hypothetical protein BO71DRAFT_449365 [Aspergillus ellipticus CBS 707.79]|uniref:Zn(2)-C6 fungal-type domain-containing protein n=1 Tax=Aspergillus ellipticus CBS 707.79 TaxID=1448320 RepID=A0A319EVI0_9EURO|nr:hypothetical protein BO71DRAFT_449365 [Aspergillus ellipticus CBS 707.79]